MNRKSLIDIGRAMGTVLDKGLWLRTALTTMNARVDMLDETPAEGHLLREDAQRIQALAAELAADAKELGRVIERGMPAVMGDASPVAAPEPRAPRTRKAKAVAAAPAVNAFEPLDQPDRPNLDERDEPARIAA